MAIVLMSCKLYKLDILMLLGNGVLTTPDFARGRSLPPPAGDIKLSPAGGRQNFVPAFRDKIQRVVTRDPKSKDSP